MKTNKIARIIYDSLSYIYCDNCRYNNEIIDDSNCECCNRKSMEWEISENTASNIANKIIEELN